LCCENSSLKESAQLYTLIKKDVRVLKITFASPQVVDAGALVVLAAPNDTLSAAAKAYQAASSGALTRAFKASRFQAEASEILEIISPTGLEASRLLIVGMGAPEKVQDSLWEQLGGNIVARLQTSGESRASVHVEACEGFSGDLTQAAVHLGIGAVLRSYRFDRYRTKEPASKKPSLEEMVVFVADPQAATQAFAQARAVVEGVFLTRDLVSEPANILYPKSFAARIQTLTSLGVKVEVLGEAEMRAQGFGALLGVSQGSAHEPQLVIMQWEGAGTFEQTPPLCFVGKGVTFDTGGISLKPPAGMEEMKWDMGGAGAVTGALHALAARKAKANVVGIVALVENMPSGTAQRPGDVVTSLSGQTIEVINTDAEGRLILCDAMTYAQNRFKPKTMVDLATLTGAMIISLGHEYAGVFANDDTLAETLLKAGAQSGDKLWRLPLGDAYDKLINSPIADMKNVGPREGGSITAAQFLKRFVHDGVAWAHLDIAGMVWAAKDSALYEKGATGYGVRLLDRFVALHEGA
jgi:leucyl aminopeptidase